MHLISFVAGPDSVNSRPAASFVLDPVHFRFLRRHTSQARFETSMDRSSLRSGCLGLTDAISRELLSSALAVWCVLLIAGILTAS